MLDSVKNFFSWLTPSFMKKPINYTESEKKVDHTASNVLNNNAAANSSTSLSGRDCKVLEEECPKVSSATRKFFNKVRSKGKKPSDPTAITEAMKNIGGKNLRLKTQKGHMMNAMHFNFSNVMEQMKLRGAQKIVISKGQESIPAFVLDSNDRGNLKKSLEQLGFFKENVWKEEVIEGKTYIFSAENHRKFKKDFQKGFKGKLNPQLQSEIKQIEVDHSPKKTMVIYGGVHSYYNSKHTAEEVSKYLSLGFNVIVSDDKHDKLENAESHENVMSARHAVYQYLSEEGVKNEDIIWSGTCFSSAPAMECAAKYAGSHAIFNQGYSSMKNVANEMSPWVPSFIVNRTCSKHDFNFEVEEHLDKIKGKVIVISNEQDSKFYKDECIKVKKALRKRETLTKEFVTMNTKGVGHAVHWFKCPKANQSMTAALHKHEFANRQLIS